MSPPRPLGSCGRSCADDFLHRSDGYNAQIVGYAKLVLESLFPKQLTSILSTRLSNAYLIGEIVGRGQR